MYEIINEVLKNLSENWLEAILEFFNKIFDEQDISDD